jgi:hypothetical protein
MLGINARDLGIAFELANLEASNALVSLMKCLARTNG